MMKTYKYLIIPVFIFLLLCGCGKEEEKNALGEFVNFKVNVTVQDKELATPTNNKQFLKPRLAREGVGFSGLLVVCSAVPITSSIYELYVYDLCCRHENKREIRIVPEEDGMHAKCPSCGSTYNIINGVGNVVSGPAKNNLQKYRAVYSASEPGLFIISN